MRNHFCLLEVLLESLTLEALAHHLDLQSMMGAADVEATRREREEHKN